MENIYFITLMGLMCYMIYGAIRCNIVYPPSLHFIGRVEKAQLSQELQDILDEKEKIGTRYAIKLGISLFVCILLILLYPILFGNI